MLSVVTWSQLKEVYYSYIKLSVRIPIYLNGSSLAYMAEIVRVV